MADKIANFEDYVKRDVKQENSEKRPVPEKQEKEKPIEPVRQETMEIEIEDPFQFLSAEERDEYLEQRKKEAQKEEAPENLKDEAAHGAAKEPQEEPEKESVDESERAGVKRHEAAPDDASKTSPKADHERNYPDEEYDDGYEEECEREEESAGGVNMDLVVRIASVITAMVILFFAGMLFKIKVYDRFMAPDPDEVQTVVVAIPEGYTEKNDTVVVTGASSLNLRSGPDTSSTIITTANEGTELKRIAVADDGKWAFVEYEGQQLYASMKYLKEK